MIKAVAKKVIQLVLKLIVAKVEELLNEDIDGDGKIGSAS